jgi:hypothetical protein
MAHAITVFGVGGKNKPAVVCYVYMRSIRGSGDYPAPVLPKSAQRDGLRRLSIADFNDLGLFTWDKLLDESAAPAIRAQLDAGLFVVPKECPMESGQEIKGQAFGPLIIAEKNVRVGVSGTGFLYARGIAIDGGLNRLTDCIESIIGAAEAPAALKRVIELVTDQTGLGLIFKERRRLGVADFFCRAQDDASLHGMLFNVMVDKPGFRDRKPMRRVKVKRDCAPLDQSFQLHVTLKNYDEILREVLIEVPAGQAELFVEADAHITDADLAVFYPDGNIADLIGGSFAQGLSFGITAQGRSDELPEVFRGAPESADLQTRARLHTTAFHGPSVGNRSGGLDAVRRLRSGIDRLMGEPTWEGENQWFEVGGDGQIEAIRWIKGKLEQPDITEAYLVDPYLGSEALQRVIARQGHENITLKILVSPGKIDPDADAVDAEAKSDHLAKLLKAADEWSDRLCGRISIIHIQRGDGRRQAFHDRYLCLVDQRGVPAVYLLSNSLSKAAGYWPFTICELSRIMSWRVLFYIIALVKGENRDRDLHTFIVWQSAEVSSSIVAADATQVAGSVQPEWVQFTNTFLKELQTAIYRNSEDSNEIVSLVDSFLKKWPENVDAKTLADYLFRLAGHRGECIFWIASRFAAGTAGQREVADKLDAMALDKFISELPRDGERAKSYPPFRNRDGYLRYIGRVIAGKPAPTNFVRDRLNPVVNDLVETIETQRFGGEIAGDAFLQGVWLVSVSFEVAVAAEAAKIEHRIGLAADYIHWTGRLMRSEMAFDICNTSTDLPDIVGNDLVLAAEQIASARKMLGDSLAEPVKRVLSDPLVLSAFKDMLNKAIANGTAKDQLRPSL